MPRNKTTARRVVPTSEVPTDVTDVGDEQPVFVNATPTHSPPPKPKRGKRDETPPPTPSPSEKKKRRRSTKNVWAMAKKLAAVGFEPDTVFAENLVIRSTDEKFVSTRPDLRELTNPENLYGSHKVRLQVSRTVILFNWSPNRISRIMYAESTANEGREYNCEVYLIAKEGFDIVIPPDLATLSTRVEVPQVKVIHDAAEFAALPFVTQTHATIWGDASFKGCSDHLCAYLQSALSWIAASDKCTVKIDYDLDNGRVVPYCGPRSPPVTVAAAILALAGDLD